MQSSQAERKRQEAEIQEIIRKVKWYLEQRIPRHKHRPKLRKFQARGIAKRKQQAKRREELARYRPYVQHRSKAA